MNAEKKLQKREYDLARNRLLKELEIDKGKVYRKYTRLNINTKPDNQPIVSNVIEPVIIYTKQFEDFTPNEQTQLTYIRQNYGEAYFQEILKANQ
jgi:hypothetical protein